MAHGLKSIEIGVPSAEWVEPGTRTHKFVGSNPRHKLKFQTFLPPYEFLDFNMFQNITSKYDSL